MLNNLLHKEGVLSIVFHFFKSLLALYINWLILNKFPTEDYVVWAVASSILMVATASDLGIGQHTVTSLLESKKKFRAVIILKACAAIFPLFIFSLIFVMLSLQGNYTYVLLMSVFVSLRLFSIPFGSLFNAFNKYKIRKIIEFLTYLIASISITFIVLFKKNIELSLLALNASFLIGSIILIIISKKYVSIRKNDLKYISFSQIFKVFRGSLPFLVNNLTTLLTYGGFIWVCSFILPSNLLAKISVFHVFFMMTLYQLYDVYLRSRQADLIITKKIKFILKLNRLVVILIPLFFLFFGKLILNIIAPTLSFEFLEVFLFAVFIILEFCFLIIQSIVQVNFKYASNLYYYSFIKIISIVLPFLISFLYSENINLIFFLSLINFGSLVGIIISNHHFKSKSEFSLWSS